MYLAYVLTVACSPNFSSPIAFTCMVHRNLPTSKIFPVYSNTHVQMMNVHLCCYCSDGCGRTGTFIAIYYTIERLKVAGIVDIFQAIKNSRLSRCNLVSNLVSRNCMRYNEVCSYVFSYLVQEQYESCHEIVLEFLDEFEAYANFK